MVKFFNKLLLFFTNLLYPKNLKCILCDKEMETESTKSICEQCEKNLSFNTNYCHKCGCPIGPGKKYCGKCSKSRFYFKKARAPFIYCNQIKHLILQIKFKNKKFLTEYLAKYMCDTIVLENYKFDIVIPVPLSKKSLRKRGFNQSELLARCIANTFNKPLITDTLLKTKETKQQSLLTFEERQNNIKGCFAVLNNKEIIKNKTVLLVDDIYTTGATVEECSQVLMDNNAKEVFVITLAHTKKD